MTEQQVRAVQVFSARVYVILALLIVVQVATGIASVYLLTRDHNRSVAVADLAVKNQRAVAQIQRERIRNTRAACVDTNREHAALVGFIKASIPRGRLHDPRVVTYLARAARSFPILDCDRVVRDKIKAKP